MPEKRGYLPISPTKQNTVNQVVLYIDVHKLVPVCVSIIQQHNIAVYKSIYSNYTPFGATQSTRFTKPNLVLGSFRRNQFYLGYFQHNLKYSN